MTGWAEALVAGALALAGPAAAGTAGSGDRTAPAERLFSFTDPEINESSGLVDAGRLVFTVNDSGDGPRIFAVDARSGDTVGVREYAGEAVDVEALAPGSGRTLWVGDIGDNLRRRPTVAVYRVPWGPGGQRRGERFELRYPDGPRDAETLLVQPGTGRVFVVSKSVFGGTVYIAPRRLDAGVNRLRRFATVPGLVTDGAFLPDGRHVLLRGYGSAAVYTFPDFALRDTVRLPAQPQGEAVAVGPDGRVLLSSEGVHADVLRVRLPADLLAEPPSGAAPAGPAPTPRPADPPWVGLAVVGAGAVGLGWLAVRAVRRRGPRSR